MMTAAMQQQQGQQEKLIQNEQEYLSAQRAAVESVLVGRETLQQADQQGEQLARAEQMADETQYKLDKAGRVLRGMTWSGWVANMFSKDVHAPGTRAGAPPDVYENVPDSCRAAAQAIQNYHANVKVLESCETEEQRETCKIICDSMYEAAETQINKLGSGADVEAYVLEFQSHLETLRERQIRRNPEQRAEQSSSKESTPKKANLMPEEKKQPPPNDPIVKMQDEHLQVISENLGELGSIGHSLSQAVDQQNEIIDSLDTKADNIVEKSKMVTRRADRMIQKKAWKPVKPTFAGHVSIRHIATGRYLATIDGNLFLVPTLKENGVFGLWKRQGDIFGLQSKHSRRWMGQNMFGGLVCSASSFGRREEWEADPDWTSTRLLCASAGWGAGGYIMVRPGDFGILIGGSSVEERKKADLWTMSEYLEG